MQFTFKAQLVCFQKDQNAVALQLWQVEILCFKDDLDELYVLYQWAAQIGWS